ncbi:MAG: hypothetical protein ACOVSR_02200 [Bacteroidia bacterium]
MINYLKHTEIDKTKWDYCISHASNTIIYAYAWYLDIVSPNWDALVLNDYEAVMPLTHRKKYFISYLFQPFFTQQLGVFSKNESQALLVQDFLNAIPSKFKLIDINLNEENSTEGLKPRKNYLLPIDEGYKDIYTGYKGQAKRNLKKAKDEGLFLQALPYKQVIDFYQKHKGKETKGVKENDYKTLKQLYKICNKQNNLLAVGVYSNQFGLLGAAAFIINGDRAIFHLGTSNEKGKKMGAMHFLMDSVIMQLCGKNLFLDFEGSEIDGIERFYKSFGAYKKPYFKYRKNNLPKLLAWIK